MQVISFTRPWALRRLMATEGLMLVWLIADQGIFALTNFIINVLFARWLSPVEYGMFVVSFSGYLLLTVFHFGAILEPLLVQSAQVDPTRRRSFVVTLIKLHVILFIGISALAALGFVVAYALDVPNVGYGIVGAAVGGSLIMTLLATRRLCLVFLTTRVSALIGILYMVSVLTTTTLIHQYGQVSWLDLWWVMGGWSFLCSVVIFIRLYTSVSGSSPYSLRVLWRFQWQYARYGMIAAVCSWVRVDGVLLLLARFAGLEAIAETRAVLNVFNPMSQVHMALHSSWLVRFTRDRSHAGLWHTMLIVGAALALLVGAMFAGSTQLVDWLYRGRYLNGAWILPLYCLSQAWNMSESLFSCYLKAGGFLRRGYAPQIIGSILCLGIGLLLIPSIGQRGFIIAVLVSFGVGVTLAITLVETRRLAVE